MTLSLTCQNCKEPITGEDEDELVANVQAHVRNHGSAHGISHEVSREQILTRLQRQERRNRPTTPEV